MPPKRAQNHPWGPPGGQNPIFEFRGQIWSSFGVHKRTQKSQKNEKKTSKKTIELSMLILNPFYHKKNKKKRRKNDPEPYPRMASEYHSDEKPRI